MVEPSNESKSAAVIENAEKPDQSEATKDAIKPNGQVKDSPVKVANGDREEEQVAAAQSNPCEPTKRQKVSETAATTDGQ